jgi:HAD superfamily hydrolase (TIGR01509 family)
VRVLKAIIFDADGTLAETAECHREAFNRAFADAGLSWHWSEAQYRELLKVTGGRERLAHFIEGMGGVGLGVTLVNRLIADLHRRKTAIYAEMIASGGIGLRPGVTDLIDGALSENIRLAVASTTSRPNVEALLRATLGTRGAAAFEVIAAGDCVRQKKPAPDIFRTTLDQLRLAPHDCLAIEDSENGLRAAMGAGLPVLVTPSRYSAGGNFAGAAQVVEALPQLASRLALDGCRWPQPAALVAAVRRLHDEAAFGAIRAA